MTLPSRRVMAATILGALAALMLAGCLILPGRFDSALDVRSDGTFRFHYAGEIVFLPLTDAMKSQTGAKSARADPTPPDQTEVFSEQTCTRPDTGEVRACTPDDIAAQRRAFEARKKSGKTPGNAPDADGALAMMAAMGGGNAGAPPDGETIATALRRQNGWSKVIYRGNGVFDVVFDAAGPLTHDFIFPTIEKVPLMVPLLSVHRHSDGAVRVIASGFTGGLSGLGALANAGKDGNNPLKGLPPVNGTFTLTTNGTILANNTEEGPAAIPGGQKLVWSVTSARKDAPTALIGAGK